MLDRSTAVLDLSGRQRGMGRAPRILIVAPGIPHPNEGGSSVVFYEYIKALKEAGCHVLNVLLLQPDNSSEARLAEYRKGLEQAGQFEVLPCHSPMFVTSRHMRHRFDQAAAASISGQMIAFQPDAVLALDIACAWAVAGLPLKGKVAWLGDLNFETLWYATLYARHEGNSSLKYLFGTGLYALLWAWIYRRVLRRFDRVIVCAKSSERAMARIGVEARYLPYPWPRLSDRPRDPAKLHRQPSLLFFGGLGGLGSRSAFHLLMDEIYPLLVESFGRGGFRIVICGRGSLPGWAKRSIEARPEIDFRGYVADLDDLMDECHALLAPIDVPVGNRTRILTAISRHLLVIAHRNTALGNPDLIDGKTCYLAATPQEFVDRIRRAVDSPAETRRMVEEAYRSYWQSFGPEHAIPPMFAEIERAAATDQS